MSQMLFAPGCLTCIDYWAKTLTLVDLKNKGACSHDKLIVCRTFACDTGYTMRLRLRYGSGELVDII